MSSVEALELSQRCADGDADVAGTTCSPVGANAIFEPTDELDPPGSGADIWDPARGITPLSSHLSTFELIFSLAYGVRGEPMWEFLNEMSVGLPGLLGRQVELSKKTWKLPGTAAAVAELEAAADEGKIVATAHSRKLGRLIWDGSAWASVATPATTYAYADLEKLAKKGKANVTFRADLPAGVSALTPQPILNSDPASIAVEVLGGGPAIPTPAPGEASSHILGYKYLEAGATVLLDGVVCGECAIALNPGGGFEGADVLTLDLPGLAAGIHVVQARNPSGLASNEMPVLSKVPEVPEP
jgi:hypothetical protein